MVKGSSEKLRHILKSHRIRSTLYTESPLRKLGQLIKNYIRKFFMEKLCRNVYQNLVPDPF